MSHLAPQGHNTSSVRGDISPMENNSNHSSDHKRNKIVSSNPSDGSWRMQGKSSNGSDGRRRGQGRKKINSSQISQKRDRSSSPANDSSVRGGLSELSKPGWERR